MKSKFPLVTLLALPFLTGPAAADPFVATLFNNIIYVQTSNNTVTPLATPNFFSLGADQAPSGYTSAQATYPGGTQTIDQVAPGSFNFNSSEFTTQADLHSSYPFGLYTIKVSNSTSSESATINYSKDLFASITPFLTNFDDLNGLNPSKDFTATFAKFDVPAGAEEGFTFFSIGSAFDAGFQPNTTTSTLIHANTLAPNTTYEFQLDYSVRLSGCETGTFCEQGFDIRTLGEFTTGAVPEISTWVMMIFGFAGIGFLTYRRRKQEPMLEAA